MARFGVLFTTTRGPSLQPAPGATYIAKDPLTGWVSTPKLQVTPGQPHWSLRLPAVLVLLTKLCLAALVCGCHGGLSASGSVAQASLLLVITCGQLVYVVTARPWNVGALQAGMTTGALVELLLAACLVAATAQTTPTMAVSNALVALVVVGLVCYGVLLVLLVVAAVVCRWQGQRVGRRMGDVVGAVVRQQPSVLQRKYADRYGGDGTYYHTPNDAQQQRSHHHTRWLVRVFGVGLYNRPARAHELAAPPTPTIALGLTPWRRALCMRGGHTLSSADVPAYSPKSTTDALSDDKCSLSSIDTPSIPSGKSQHVEGPLGSPGGLLLRGRSGSSDALPSECDTLSLATLPCSSTSASGSPPRATKGPLEGIVLAAGHPPPLLHSSQGVRISTAVPQDDGVEEEDEFMRVPSSVLRAIATPNADVPSSTDLTTNLPDALEREPTFTTWSAQPQEDTPPTTMPSLSRWSRARKQSAASVDWNDPVLSGGGGGGGGASAQELSDRALEHAESGMAQHADVLLDSLTSGHMEGDHDGRQVPTSLSDVNVLKSSLLNDNVL